jgi:carbon-monoxide dehydrogenase large subunit
MNMPAAPLIGQPVDRAEDRRFLTGAGTFVDDLKRAGMLHAVVLRSSVAHGRINGVDASAARARKGVRAVITAAEIGTIPLIPLRLANLPEFAPYLQPVIAKDKVRYVGEPIAVVVAETQALAEDALEAIDVDIAPLPALPDRHAAASDKSLLFETSGSNRAVRYSVTSGDADAAFAKAEYTRRESFRCHRLTAVPLETRGLIAEWDARSRSSSFSAPPRFCSSTVACRPCGPFRASIDMIELDVGGGFGARRVLPEDFSSRPRPPCRPSGQMDRGSPRASDVDQSLARGRLRPRDRLHRDGRILGLRGHIYGDMGAISAPMAVWYRPRPGNSFRVLTASATLPSPSRR